MKKILTLALAAVALFATSCQKAEVVNGETNVTIKVGMPATKAIGDGTTATNLIFEVYYVQTDEENNRTYTLITEGTKKLENYSTELSFTLMRNSTYVALFWAQSPAAPYLTDDLRNVAMNYTGDTTIPNGNNENRDAFCGCKEFTISDDDTANTGLTCELNRPLSQINFVATDYEEREQNAIKNLALTSSKVTLSSLSTHYNVLTGQAASIGTDLGNYTFHFDAGDALTEEFDSTDETQTWVSMNYVLLPEGATSVDVSAVFNVNATYSTGTVIPHVVTFPTTTVTAGENFRTNIVGELFTEGGKINITVDPSFNTPDNDTTID